MNLSTLNLPPVALLALLFVALALAIQLASIGLAALHLRRGPAPRARADLPRVSLLRPVCGLDPMDEATLGSSFGQDYPDYEVIFCVASATDPAVALVNRLIAEHPEVPARLLVGDERVSGNPKLNNLVKGWAAARTDWIVMADSNLALPADYLRDMIACFTPGIGLVSSPAAGTEPAGMAARLEAAFLNTHQARWQLAADQLGLGFAQGKTLFWRPEVLEKAGGMAALGTEMAEDVAATKIVRRAGLKVRLAPRPFAQPLGRRGWGAVWSRQIRWARVRRLGFPGIFMAEALNGVLPSLAALTVAVALGAPLALLPVFVVFWFGAELWLARQAGWPHGLRDLLAWGLRDALMPAVWLWCWFGNDFVWRGNAMRAGDVATASDPAAPPTMEA